MAKISLFALLLLVLSSASAQPIPYLPPATACKGDISLLIDQCAKFVKITGPTVPPSAACCHAIQGADIPCLCKTYFTPRIEKLISMKKAVFVAAKCDRPLAHKSKCGNYTVPAA